jgi:S1-C subfamily serine protease
MLNKCLIYIIKFSVISLLIFSVSKGDPLTGETEAPKYNISSAKYIPSFQSNNKLDFYDFISGINSVYVVTDNELSAKLFNDVMFESKYRKLLINYLHGIGIQNVAISTDEQNQLDKTVSLTTAATFRIKLDYTGMYISKIYFSFSSCNKDEFQFSLPVDYYIQNKWDEFLLESFKKMYWYSVSFNSGNSYKLNSVTTNWNEEKIVKYLDGNSIDKVEGIYEKFGSGDKFRIGIVKESDLYKLIYLSGAKNKFDWKEGDLKGIAKKTAVKDFYKIDWVMSDKSTNSNVYFSTKEEHFLNFDFMDPAVISNAKYLKMYPTFSSEITVSQSFPSASGTGFLISKEGLIVTDHHVIENGGSIIVNFNDDDPVRNYKCKILADDKLHDLSILAIIDDNFKLSEDIPYKISLDESEVGTSVFTLGYPLIETMGESIKLNDGIISSKTGFLNDQSSYQLSIPINPGNSGGPLFDKTGNLIGVINAKHSSAENAAYALKSIYLFNLLKKLPAYYIEKAVGLNKIHYKSFSKLVKSVQKYICLIKVN